MVEELMDSRGRGQAGGRLKSAVNDHVTITTELMNGQTLHFVVDQNSHLSSSQPVGLFIFAKEFKEAPIIAARRVIVD
jgi:hypothetical protein